MKFIELKCDKDHFWDVWNGVKLNEVRYNDRHYEVGDLITLKETLFPYRLMEIDPEVYPLSYTGREILVQVTHILRDNYMSAGLREDWCVLSIKVLVKKAPSGEIE